MRRRLWAALALSVSGLVVVGQVWQGLRLDGLGVLAGLGAAVSLAAYYLTSERGLGRRDPLSLAAWTFTAAALFWSVLQPWWTFPWADLTRGVGVPGPLPDAVVPAWVLVGWVVVLGTVVPYGLILVALGSLGSARTGLLGMVEPVLAGAVAWVVLGEALSALQLPARPSCSPASCSPRPRGRPVRRSTRCPRACCPDLSRASGRPGRRGRQAEARPGGLLGRAVRPERQLQRPQLQPGGCSCAVSSTDRRPRPGTRASGARVGDSRRAAPPARPR